MGGGTSKPQPQIRTYVAGELAEVTESTDGSRSSALRSEKSNYSAPGNPAQPTKGPGKVAFAEPDPDSPGHLSEAPTTPSESPGGTWQDPTAGYMSPTTDAATSPAGVPGGVPTLVPLSKTTIDPLSKLDNRRGSLIDGSVESELSALREEFDAFRTEAARLQAEMEAALAKREGELLEAKSILETKDDQGRTLLERLAAGEEREWMDAMRIRLLNKQYSAMVATYSDKDLLSTATPPASPLDSPARTPTRTPRRA